MPTDKQLEQIATVLAEWNPLGDNSGKIADLNGYRTEADDIAFGLAIIGPKANVARMTCDVLNGAFGIDLSVDDCLHSATEIQSILKCK